VKFSLRKGTVRPRFFAAGDRADGTGDLMSVNSCGYTNSSGMAGPKLSGTSVACCGVDVRTEVPRIRAVVEILELAKEALCDRDV